MMMSINKRYLIIILLITTFMVILDLTTKPIKPSLPPAAYCHACQCGKVATKCINECNSRKICAIMCANSCNSKKMSALEGHSPELQADFNLLNQRFFGAALPKTNVYLSNQVEDDWIGYTVPCGPQPQYCIHINEKLAPVPREQQWVLRHETCHVATWNLDVVHPHGEKWQECMINLADKGAFTGVW